MTMLVAAGQVYFRDLKSFLPYATRVWLYATPILYYAGEVPDRYDWILTVNPLGPMIDRKSTRLNSSHANISYAVFCLKKKLHTLGPHRPSDQSAILYLLLGDTTSLQDTPAHVTTCSISTSQR